MFRFRVSEKRGHLARKFFYELRPRRNIKPIPQFARPLVSQSTRFPARLPAPL
jgi:hypothetical protein